MFSKKPTPDCNLTVFKRLAQQFTDISNKGCQPDCVYMSRDAFEDFKRDSKDAIRLMLVELPMPGDNFCAKYCGVPVRMVIDVEPSYIHVSFKLGTR